MVFLGKKKNFFLRCIKGITNLSNIFKPCSKPTLSMNSFQSQLIKLWSSQCWYAFLQYILSLNPKPHLYPFPSRKIGKKFPLVPGGLLPVLVPNLGVGMEAHQYGAEWHVIHADQNSVYLSAKNRNATKTSKSSCFRMGPRLLKNIHNWISSAILETFQHPNSTATAGFSLPLAPHRKHPSESYTPSRDTFEIHFVFSAAWAAGGHG